MKPTHSVILYRLPQAIVSLADFRDPA